jgi:hypothetical protein
LTELTSARCHGRSLDHVFPRRTHNSGGVARLWPGMAEIVEVVRNVTEHVPHISRLRDFWANARSHGSYSSCRLSGGKGERDVVPIGNPYQRVSDASDDEPDWPRTASPMERGGSIPDMAGGVFAGRGGDGCIAAIGCVQEADLQVVSGGARSPPSCSIG